MVIMFLTAFGSLQGIADAKDERLVVSLDQIQRLASGLSRNASYKLDGLTAVGLTPPAPTSDAKPNHKHSPSGLMNKQRTSSLQVEIDSLKCMGATLCLG